MYVVYVTLCLVFIGSEYVVLLTTSVYVWPCASGGETIRELNRESGAHIELSRQPAPNPRERMFRIEGTPDEIQHAIQLICEKAGIVSTCTRLPVNIMLC